MNGSSAVATMFQQAFKNIDDVLWKEAGCTTELDYTEQTSWLLFLKYLDDLEQDKSTEASLEGKKYSHILDKPYRWETWAAPKDKSRKLDHNVALTGDDLRDFVNGKLFPYLNSFKQKASGPNTIEYKIGEIFGEIKNKIQSGYNLREIIDHIDELRFRSQTEKHELSHLYEAKEDLKHFATEEDLKHFATKLDLVEFKDDIIEAVRKENAKVIQSNDKVVTKLDTVIKELAAGDLAYKRIDDTLENHKKRIGKLEGVVGVKS